MTVTIKNRDELKKYLNEYKDLIINDNLVIEFNLSEDDVRDITCGDIKCRDIKCGDINCGDISCGDINCVNINCWDISCGDINCKNLSYYAFCTTYNSIKCESWEKRRDNGLDPICLDEELIILNNKYYNFSQRGLTYDNNNKK